MNHDFHSSLAAPKGILAADQLRREILSGLLPAGAKLRQGVLAARFGISQIPLREAMRQLLEEGLVRIEPFVGAVVAPLEPEEILEAARIRILLECDALDLAFPFHTAATLAHARTCWNALAAARTALGSYEAMESFLIALYTPAARPMHLAQILSLYRRSQRIVGHLPTIIARLDPTTPLPIAILGHLEDGNVEMAKRSLSVLYRHAAIHGAAILYEQQIQTPAVSHRPRGRPKKLPG